MTPARPAELHGLTGANHDDRNRRDVLVGLRPRLVSLRPMSDPARLGLARRLVTGVRRKRNDAKSPEEQR